MTDQQMPAEQAPVPVEELTFNEAPDIEEGVYPAVLTALERVSGTNMDTGEPEDFLGWQFAVQAHGETIDLRGSSSLATGPNSKAFGWATALLGSKRMNDTNVKLNPQTDLIGCACQVEVAFNAKGYPKVKSVIAPTRL
jgi:hypothetical protein